MKYLSVIWISLVILTSCEPVEDTSSPDILIQGEWVISSTFFLGQNIPGDGSTLTFNACSPNECTGADFKSGDETSGTFTYVLEVDGNSVIIVDPTTDGGNYNGTWQILKLTSSNLKITQEYEIFGVMQIELTH